MATGPLSDRETGRPEPLLRAGQNMSYNFVRVHQTLRVTPAMAAGVTDRLFTIQDIVRLVDMWEEQEKQRKSLMDLRELRAGASDTV